MRVDQNCSWVLLSPEAGTAKEMEAYDRYVKPKKAESFSRTKGTVSRSMPVVTGQFNGRPNITTLSLTRLSRVFFVFSNFPSSQLVSSWSHEINADPAVLDQSMCVCDTPMLASRLCMCARVLERMSTQQGFG